MEGVSLFKSTYIPATGVYAIKRPDIISGGTYYFETGSGLVYQVTFGKKKNNYLGNILNFSVISDEFEDEYSETNKGEVYRIIGTVTEIVRIFHEIHPYSNSYEFSGEFKKENDPPPTSIRTRMYFRSAQRVIDQDNWNISIDGNRVLIKRR